MRCLHGAGCGRVPELGVLLPGEQVARLMAELKQ